jgi:hypothetical protein
MWRTPLCPAGHLPHKEGDWLGAPARSPLTVWQGAHSGSISPLVGEMPGRAEGGNPGAEAAASCYRPPITPI